MKSKPAELSAGLVAIKGAAAPSPDMPGRAGPALAAVPPAAQPAAAPAAQPAAAPAAQPAAAPAAQLAAAPAAKGEVALKVLEGLFDAATPPGSPPRR
jgi:hypothetical protein